MTTMFAMLLSIGSATAHAQEDRSGLTPASYRRNCIMCHGRAAPDGVSPEILSGLKPVAGLKPREAMPSLKCWRRCENCWPRPKTDAAAARK